MPKNAIYSWTFIKNGKVKEEIGVFFVFSRLSSTNPSASQILRQFGILTSKDHCSQNYLYVTIEIKI